MSWREPIRRASPPRVSPLRALITLIAMICLGLPPNGVTAQSEAPVLDFADIQSGEVGIVLDPSGTLATVEVSTTIDAACAVAFGEDGTLGRLGTDVDMAAGGHRDHRVLLGGLQPGTAFVFRLQGSGVDGNLYRSRLYSFRTPVPPIAAPENHAIGARMTDVSSEFSAAFLAANAVDGDLSTEWSTRGDGDDAFITLDLGRVLDVSAVAFRTRQMGDGSSMTATFSITVDGEAYGPFPAGPEPVPVEFSGRIVRLDVDTSTGGNTGAVERGPLAPSAAPRDSGPASM